MTRSCSASSIPIGDGTSLERRKSQATRHSCYTLLNFKKNKTEGGREMEEGRKNKNKENPKEPGRKETTSAGKR